MKIDIKKYIMNCINPKSKFHCYMRGFIFEIYFIGLLWKIGLVLQGGN